MKQRYCTICGSRLPKGKQESGEWVSADGKQRIPLYYCSSECMQRHIFSPTAELRPVRSIKYNHGGEKTDGAQTKIQ